MPRYLVKLADNEYVEWSTIVDAPVTDIMGREEAIEYSLTEYPAIYDRQIAVERLDRTDKNGHSSFVMGPQSIEELVEFNRAGDSESTASLEEIRQNYRRNS